MGRVDDRKIEQAYDLARERYATIGVDADRALETLAAIPISLHCWQGDDVSGFENSGEELGGGLAVTGNYPGRARTVDELRADLEIALSVIPGRHRLNLHAIYLDSTVPVERTAIEPRHFQSWVDWARERGLHGLDFNPTCFSHPMAASGFTLASTDAGVRDFWIDHCRASRRIGEFFGRELGTPCVTNIWIPDGFKDTPVDRNGARRRLAEALDRVLEETFDPRLNLDAVESKLFGIGSESCVIGSHEFYLGYAASRRILLCLDAGHFHPTEVISDKISSVLMWVPELLLHVSRGVRWDSDHVVTLSDELRAIAEELVRGEHLARTHIGLDYFDASINRVAAWAIGTRAMLRALLMALLGPTATLRELEEAGEYTRRLALLEELKGMPSAAVWDMHCLRTGAGVGCEWLDRVMDYEKQVLSKRD